MRWKAKADGWKAAFAWFPVKIGDEWIWWERYERQFMGECYFVRLPSPALSSDKGDEMREALAFIDKFFEPWGAWKTPRWEGEVSDDAAFSADNALKHVANMLRRVRPTARAQEREK